MFKNLQCHLQFENDLKQSLFDSDRQLIKQCYFSLEIKYIKISWCHVKKLLFPSNAYQAVVLESFFGVILDWSNKKSREH